MSPGWRWLTPPGPAALALLRLWAPPAGLLAPGAPAPGQARRTQLRLPDGSVVEDGIAWGEADGCTLAVHGGDGMRAAVGACLQAHGVAEAAVVPPPTRWQRLAAAPSPGALAWLLADVAPPCDPAFLQRLPVVCIAGPANVGKSTLLNAWCGHERAVVAATPGTTRDLVSATVPCGAWRVTLVDSAGERDADDALERAGQALARAQRAVADLVLYLAAPWADATARPEDLVVLGQADCRAALPAGALVWSAVGLPGAAPAALLARLEAAVAARLALTLPAP